MIIKRTLFLILAASMLLFGTVTAFASNDVTYVADHMDILSPKALTELNSQASLVYERFGFEVLFILKTDIEIDEMFDYAHITTEVGTGSDCILLIFNESWESCVYARGKPYDKLTSAIADSFVDAFNAADTYYDGIHDYIALAEKFLEDNFDEIKNVSKTEYKLLMDEADLLTSSQESVLLAKLEEISARQGMDVVVITVESLNGKSSMDFADDYFDYNGYGQGTKRSGVLLLHSPEERDWWISTRGEGIYAFTDAGIDYIGEQIKPKLASDDFNGAYTIFADECDEFISQAKTGEPFDRSSLPRNPFGFGWIIASIAIGFVVAVIVVGVMKGKLKSIRTKADANDCVREGSIVLTDSRDVFLYKTVSSVKRASESSSGGSSSHSGSSGASHGGGGGKY